MNELIDKSRACAERLRKSKFPDYHAAKWIDRIADALETQSSEGGAKDKIILDLKSTVACYQVQLHNIAGWLESAPDGDSMDATVKEIRDDVPNPVSGRTNP